jgi:hypothetical protein
MPVGAGADRVLGIVGSMTCGSWDRREQIVGGADEYSSASTTRQQGRVEGETMMTKRLLLHNHPYAVRGCTHRDCRSGLRTGAVIKEARAKHGPTWHSSGGHEAYWTVRHIEETKGPPPHGKHHSLGRVLHRRPSRVYQAGRSPITPHGPLALVGTLKKAEPRRRVAQWRGSRPGGPTLSHALPGVVGTRKGPRHGTRGKEEDRSFCCVAVFLPTKNHPK